MTGDATLHLDRIKVKNSEAWSNSHQPRKDQNESTASNEEQTVIINTSVKVTYYRMSTFMETFKDYFQSPEVIY